MLTPNSRVVDIIVDVVYLIPCNHLFISPILVKVTSSIVMVD